MVTDARTPALGSADQRWVRALGALLPAGFRDRQRGEWAADLLMLSHDPAQRRRYLLGATRSLPALRAAVRGHETVMTQPSGLPSAVTAWRVLVIMLAWTTIGWLTTVLLPYMIVQTGPDPSSVDVWGWVHGPALILGVPLTHSSGADWPPSSDPC